MATAPGNTRTADKSPAQTFALVFGAVYLLVGILGFFYAEEFTGGSANDKLLGLFPINHLHNIVHLLIGAAWIGASRRHDTAKSTNTGIGVVYLLVAALGFLGLEFMDDLLNIQGSGSGDNWLHLASGALAVYFGTAGAEGNRTTTQTA